MEPFPTREAEKLLKEWEINSLPVNPIQIAQNNQITCKAMPPSGEGISGALINHGNSFGILYATHIDNEGFQNFSVAHELGHYFLPEHPENVFTNGIHQSKSGFISDDRYEKEADHFACGLLMPSFLFDRELQKVASGLDAVKLLAEKCKTSLTSTAIRYAQRHHEATAIIVSSNGRIEYCFMSDELKEFPSLNWIKKGGNVPKNTKTSLFDQQKIKRGDEDQGTSDLVTWFNCDYDFNIYEEVIGLGKYGKALTILSCPDLPNLEDIEEDAELEESWTPRHRR
jgi:IrrE N-terminal-like domain